MLATLLDYFLILSGVIIGGGLISVTVVANVMPYLERRKKDKEALLEKKRIKDYELEYYDDFETLEDVNYDRSELLKLKFNDITEETPLGGVIMMYNVHTESFFYYTDIRNISYKYLDTVARKFAIENNCKGICINYRDQFNKGKEKYIENQENQTEEDDDKMKKVYAKLKSYNKKDSKKDKKCIITENANRFTYKGKLKEYKLRFKIPEKKHKEISYKDFANNNVKVKTN